MDIHATLTPMLIHFTQILYTLHKLTKSSSTACAHFEQFLLKDDHNFFIQVVVGPALPSRLNLCSKHQNKHIIYISEVPNTIFKYFFRYWTKRLKLKVPGDFWPDGSIINYGFGNKFFITP